MKLNTHPIKNHFQQQAALLKEQHILTCVGFAFVIVFTIAALMVYLGFETGLPRRHIGGLIMVAAAFWMLRIPPVHCEKELAHPSWKKRVVYALVFGIGEGVIVSLVTMMLYASVMTWTHAH